MIGVIFQIQITTMIGISIPPTVSPDFDEYDHTFEFDENDEPFLEVLISEKYQLNASKTVAMCLNPTQ